MSSIDERIVQMKFDNKQFESGAQQTISTMAELKRMFMLDGMASGIENISSKFNAFGAIGFTVLQNLTNAAIDFGRKIAGAVLDPLIEGGKKRALNIEQAKFQFKGLGMDVEQAMSDALYAVQNTAFGLDEAAVAASQFGASGVQAGDEMRNALRGISGVAAMAGSSYSDIASVFTKVAGQGRLMGDDLNRLGTRGINAAATLAAAMGTTEEAVRKMVTEGQIDFNTFSAAMSAAFGEHATKANETYTGSLANMRAAIARIGAEFATVKFESHRQMFNAMTPAIDNVKKALQPVFELYQEFQKISVDNFVEIFRALNYVEPLPEGVIVSVQKLPPLFQALKNVLEAVTRIIRPIRDAFNDVFPPVLGDTILKIGEAVQKFTHGLIISQAQGVAIKKFFVSFFTVIKMGINIIGGIVSVVFNFVRVAWELAGAIWGLIAPVLGFVKGLLPVSNGVQDSSEAIQGFFAIINNVVNFLTGPLIAALRGAGEGIATFLDPTAARTKIQEVIAWIGQLLASVGAMSNALFKGDTSGGGFFASDSKFLGVLAKIREVIVDVAKRSAEFFKNGSKGAGDFFKAIGQGLKDTFENLDIDWNMVLATINTGLLGALSIGVFKTIKKLVGSFADIKSIKDAFSGVLDSVAGALDRFNAEVKPNWADQMIKVGVALLILAGAIAIMSTVNPDNMVSSLTGLGVAMGIMIGTMFALDKLNLEPSIKASIAISLLAFALNIMASALVKMGELSWESLSKGLTGLVAAMMVLVIMAQNMGKYEKDMVKAAFAVGIMAGALYILAGAVAIFGVMPMDMLLQGGIAVATALAILTGAAIALSKLAPKMVLSAVGLMAMAAALNMLLIPITVLGLMPQEILQQGFGMMVLILGAMTGLALVLGKAGPQMALAAVGLMAMAVAINLLVLPIQLLGMMNWEVLNQGILSLAIVIGILVVAANLMQKAMVGTAAMITMSIAITILAAALWILGQVPVETLFMVVLAIAAIFAVILVAGAVAQSVAVGLLIFTLIIIALSVAVLVVAGAFALFVLAIGALAPALAALLGVLVMFSDQAGVILGMTGPLTVLGLALVVFGIGAAVAAIGVGALGLGMVLLGAGLLLIAAVGILGVTALSAVVTAMMKLLEHVPGMVILGATFLTLGGGVLVLAGGLLLLGASVMLVSMGLLLLVTLGAAVAVSINLAMKSIESAAKQSGKIEKLGAALAPLGKALAKVGTGAGASVVQVVAMTVAFAALVVTALLVGGAVATMANLIGANVPKALNSTMAAGVGFLAFVMGLLASLQSLQGGIIAFAPIVILAATSMAVGVVSNTAAVLAGSRGSMYNAGYGIGTAIVDGMRAGLQNGSSRVSSAAKAVASNALAASKRELGVNSPSKEYYKVGNWMDEGMADGQLDNIHKVTSASEKVGQEALASMRKSLSGLKNAIASDMSLQPTIRPVIDLSQVREGFGQIGSMVEAPTLRLDNSRALANSTASALAQTDADRQSTAVEVGTKTINFTQINNSPKALPEGEIYRSTRSLIPRIKEELDKP